MTGYVLDHLALTAGLAVSGWEHERREVSRLLRSAIEGGPSLDVPALCLAAAAGVRPAVASHLADLVSSCHPGAISVSAPYRTPALDAVRDAFPRLDWPAAHGVAVATGTSMPLLTTTRDSYAGVPVEVLDL
jgi:hypothetical protein